MKRVHNIFTTWAALLLLICGNASRAADTPCPVPTATEAVADYGARLIAVKFCVGDAARDPYPLTKEVATALQTPPPSTRGITKALDAIGLEAQTRSKDNPDTKWVEIAAEVSRIASNAGRLGDPADRDTFSKRSVLLVPSSWKNANNGILVLGDKKYVLDVVPKDCVDNTPCPNFEDLVATVRVAALMAFVGKELAKDATLASFADAKVRLDRWGAYRENAHSLYWWEVFVNGRLMDSKLLGEGGTAPCAKVADTRVGFCDVPTKQLVLLHPDSALRFSRTAQSANELKPALTIELIGVYSWDWESPSSAKMKNRWGVSLAASYTDTQNERKIGYGPMFHWDGYSLAITKASQGRWSLVVSVPLAGEIFGRRQQAIDELSRIKSGSLADLISK